MTNAKSSIPETSQAKPPEPADSVADERTRARSRVGAMIKGKWKLDSLLGVGGMASVFAATHRNGSRAALKIMHNEFARDANIRERFLREGYVANRIDHPGRVAILDDDITEQDEPFLVMELLEGETVQQLWRRKERRVPVEEALWIASEVLATLEVFHAQGIVHRDLKPANIFITRENVVKVLDFGVARMRGAPGEVTRAGTALGTPSFMAPEQARGVAEEVDGRADLFSVGATLYALLSGQRLHQGRSDGESFILAATQPAPSLARIAPTMPVEVVRLVDRALAWSPRNRFASAAAMRKEILRILDALQKGLLRRKSSTSLARAGDEDAAAASEEAEAPAPEVAADDDPAVLRLREAFEKVEATLALGVKAGWESAETEAKLRAAFQSIVEALRAGPTFVYVRVRPYAFTHREQIVWEPLPPFDAVPYNLFAAGLRGIQITPGLVEEELRELCGVMLIDPAADLTHEDDLASVLWETDLDHIRCDILDDFAEGNAEDIETFYEETDDIESVALEGNTSANHIEAAAMPIETDSAAIHAARHAASVLALDPVAKKALGAQLSMNQDKWRERFADVIADAFLQAVKQGDPERVTGALAASTKENVQAKTFGAVFSTFDALMKAIDAAASVYEDAAEVRAELARGVVPPDTVKMIVWEALGSAHPSSGGARGDSGPHSLSSLGVGEKAEPALHGISADTLDPAASSRSQRFPAVHLGPSGRSFARSFGGRAPSVPPVDLGGVARGLGAILDVVGPLYLDAVLDVVGLATHEGLRRTLLAYIERSISGQEDLVLRRLMTLDADVARPVLRSLAAAKTPGVEAALSRLAQGPDAGLRVEAIACLAKSPEELRDELMRLGSADDPDARIAALRALVGHGVAGAAPKLIKRAQDASFHKLPPLERREVLTTIYTLDPALAEPVLIEILLKHGILVDELVEQTRAIAAEILGERSRSMDALTASLSAMKRRWWNTQALREKAASAAALIAARLGKRISASGEVL